MAELIIKKIDQAQIKEFMPLVWDVFCEYEAQNYPDTAKLIFKKAICDENYISLLTAYGAYKDNVPVGIVATRARGKHLALFFVDGKHHKQGIGRQLWNQMLSDNLNNELTVHSSLYAVPVYEHLGFVKTGDIQTEDGLTYLPMLYRR